MYTDGKLNVSWGAQRGNGEADPPGPKLSLNMQRDRRIGIAGLTLCSS